MQQVMDLARARIMQRGGNMRSMCCVVSGHGEFRGVFINRPQGEVVPLCPKCLVDINRREAGERAAHMELDRKAAERKAWLGKFGHAGIPQRFLRKGFDTYVAGSEEQRAALDVMRQFAEQISDNIGAGRGLLVVGSTGTGKTHLVVSILKAAVRAGHSALFTSVLEAVQVVKETYRKDSDMSEREAVKMFSEPDILALDEVGVQFGSEFEMVIMTQIIDQRYRVGKSTLLISNLPIVGKSGEKDLTTILGKRVMSRIREDNDLVVMQWGDHREAA